MFTKEQIRAARGLTGFEQKFVAENIGVDPKTISNIENGKGELSSPNVAKLANFYAARGVEFIDHSGVRLKPSGLRVCRGNAEFREFYDDLYETAKTIGGDICLLNAVSHLVISALGEDFVKLQQERMRKISKNFTYRVIFAEGDGVFFGDDYCQYRWISPKFFNTTAIFIYGDKVGFARFEDNDVSVTVMEQEGVADTLRHSFDFYWLNASEPER